MRFVEKDYTDIPESLTSQDCLDNLALVLAGDKKQISSEFYRGSEIVINGKTEKEVVHKLKVLYHNKCAYCESIEHKPEIEHYRPKGRVIHVTPSHQGYYWLCYEWSNLVPSCHDCNSISGGKGNKFPIIEETKRQRTPPLSVNGVLDNTKVSAYLSPLIDEKPYLLHPEIDKPKEFFKIEANGRMKGVDTEKRGRRTISICDLNRDNLLFARQGLLDDFLEQMKYAIERFYEGLIKFSSKQNAQNQLKRDLKRIFEILKKQQSPSKPYTFTTWYAYTHFEDVFLPQIKKKKHKKMLKQAFRIFLQGNL